MPDAKWERMPVNLVNPIDIANGQPAVYRARPAYDMPQAHANNTTSAVVNIHRMAVTKHNDFSSASSALTTALLASIGEANEDTLQTTFSDLAPYMLTPRQIVDTMLDKHGVATGDDANKLLIPLSQQLTSLSDLTKHMSTFLLASQRLTRSGQGETPYNYFKLFLESVAGFPSIDVPHHLLLCPPRHHQPELGRAFSSPGKYEGLTPQVRPRNTFFRLSATWRH
jgi:hypothetical protein